jgi:predicted outer membrane repeat protein
MALPVALASAVVSAHVAGASPLGQTYFVNSATDTGATDCGTPSNTDCGIDDAITAFNADTTVGDADTIDFSSSIATFVASTPTPIDNSTSGVTLDIVGNGQSNTAVSGNNANTVFDVESVTVSISGLTIEEGYATSCGPYGGGICNGGTLNVTDSTFSGNSAPSGGGIYNDGTLTVTDSTLSDNSSGDGGGILNNEGTLTVIDSTFSGNTGFSYGGAIVNEGTVTVTGSTFSDNYTSESAPFGGGAIYNLEGTLTISHSTLSGNSARYASGVYNRFGSVSLVATIVANGGSGEDCGGAILDGGYNLDDDGSCGFSGTSFSDTPANLDPAGLQDYGGPTRTIELQADSPALDHVSLGSDCTGIDQRGVPWPDPCDIGAVQQVATITVDVSGSEVYGSIPAFTQVNDAPFGVTISGTPTCSTAGGLSVGGLNPGIYILDGSSCSGLSSSEPTHYALLYVGAANGFTVGQATPTTPTISNLPANGTYGDGFTATVSTDGDGVTSVTSNATSVCTASALTVSYVGVGTCSLTAHVAAGNDYGAADGSAQTFTVGQATPTTVAIGNLPTGGTYGGGFTATVSTDGDGATSVTSNSTSICTAGGLTVNYVGVGTCSLTAHAAVGTDYGAADGSAQTFTVAKSLQTIIFASAPPSDATVGGPTYTVTATGGASDNAVTFTSKTSTVCTVTLGVASFINPGTCTIYANQAGNADYSAAPRLGQTFVVGKGSQTIIFTSTPPSDATVGGPTYTVTATGGASGNAVTFTSKASTVCTVSLGVVSFIKPGTCTIYANQAGNADYSVAPRLGQTFVVGKGSQTIIFTSTPPSNATLGGPTYTVTATGGASGNAVTFTSATPRVCTISHGVVTFVRAGLCSINARQDGNADYTAAAPAIQSFTVG